MKAPALQVVPEFGLSTKRRPLGRTLVVAALLCAAGSGLPAGPTAGPASSSLRIFTSSIDGLRYVYVPPGSVRGGCPKLDPNCTFVEKAPHRITMERGFWMGQTEVSVAAFRRYSRARVVEMPTPPRFNPDWREVDLPMVNVTGNEAEAYCRWAGGRLPTASEWEYAARAGQSTLFPWGDSPSHDYANYSPTSREEHADSVLGRVHDVWEVAAPVGSFPANGLGLHDLIGNVEEWTEEAFQPGARVEASRAGEHAAAPAQVRAVRGGSWRSGSPELLRISFRYGWDIESIRDSLGFRCVLDRPVER